MTVGVATRSSPAPAVARYDRLFYTGMATAIALVVLVGFAPTYFLRPRFFSEGCLCTSTCTEPCSAPGSCCSSRRLRSSPHARRRCTAVWVGVGAGLAALVAAVGVTVAILSGRQNIAAGFDDPARVFLTVPLFSMTVFVALVAAAVAFRDAS